MNHARDIDPSKWKAVEDAVLCFVVDQKTDKVLLIHKKTGLGAGLINAPGGRIEKGESPKEAAIRETKEEVGLVVSELSHRGNLYFQFRNGHSIRGYVFMTDQWNGVEIQTLEADPFWCPRNMIPFDRMWADDAWWIPPMLQGCYFSGRFLFDDEDMLSMDLEIEGSNGGAIPRRACGG